MNWKPISFDWNQTRAFLVTAEQGTLSAAAKALGLTQPTLSRQVSALEAKLGVTLFERVGQRLVITQSGAQLLTHARAMGDAAMQFSLAVSGQSQQLQGLVIISASELDANFRLPKIIAQLRLAQPGIEVEVVVSNAPSDLKRREADIAIRNFHPTQNDLIAKKIGDEAIWLYGSQQYLAQLPKFSDVSELTGIKIIGFDQSDTVINILNQQGWQLTKSNFPLVTSHQQLQLELCKQGQGVIFFPEALADNEPALVRAFANKGPVMRLPVWLVCHQELRTNPRIRYVFDFIASEFRVPISPQKK